MLQEETIRKTEKERQASAEQVVNLERNLRICQDRNKELQVGIFALSVRKNHSTTSFSMTFCLLLNSPDSSWKVSKYTKNLQKEQYLKKPPKV